MKTTQGWGWLAAGVLALGLNGVYHDGGGAWAQRTVGRIVDEIAAQTGPVLALVVGRADLFMAKTGMVVARDEASSCRLRTAVAQAESRVARTEMGLASFEAMSAREEAALARVEANRARMEAQIERARFVPAAFSVVKVPVFCPRVRVEIPRVIVPRIPVVKVPAPVVQVDMLGGGPA